MILPTTTRSIEQYKRINLGVGMDRYALVCNGGILLDNKLVDVFNNGDKVYVYK